MLRTCTILGSLAEESAPTRPRLLLALTSELARGVREAGKGLPQGDHAVERERASLVRWWGECVGGIKQGSAIETRLLVLEQLLGVDHTLVETADELILVAAAESAYRTANLACCALLRTFIQVYSQLRQIPRLLTAIFKAGEVAPFVAAILNTEGPRNALKLAFVNLPVGQVDEVWETTCQGPVFHENNLVSPFLQGALLPPLTYAALQSANLRMTESMASSIASLIAQVFIN